MKSKYAVFILLYLCLGALPTFAQKPERPKVKMVEADSPAGPVSKPLDVPTTPEVFAATITLEDMQKHITNLAGDAMTGRETGTKGQEIAASYIADHFKSLDFPAKADSGTYFQHFRLVKNNWTTKTITLNKVELNSMKDYFTVNDGCSDLPNAKVKKVYFWGNSIAPSTKMKGKAVLLYQPLAGAAGTGISKNPTRHDFKTAYEIYAEQAKIATANGAQVLLVVDNNFSDYTKEISKNTRRTSWKADFSQSGKTHVPIIFLNETTAAAMLGSKSQTLKDYAANQGALLKKPIKIKTNLWIDLVGENKVLTGSNVLGYIEGSDPKYKDELLVITAHYDHLGIEDGQIHYGADDNASGTAGVLEIAEAFSYAKKQKQGPRRSVLCMLVSGEEKGLLGSKFYTDYPIFPLKNTVVNINTDMIGRIDEPHKSNPNYIYVIGADRLSTELHQLNEEVNIRYTKMRLDYTFNALNDPNNYYQRSDHYNFASKGVPAIFYFNGTHDDYHQPTDTVEKNRFSDLQPSVPNSLFTSHGRLLIKRIAWL